MIQSTTIAPPVDAECENAFPAVPYESREWDIDDDHWTPDDAVLCYSRTQPLRFFELPAVEPLSADARHAAGDAYWDALAAAGITRLPAISGGASDDIPPPYEPTPADWAEYRRVFDAEDAELIGTAAMRAWYAVHPISEFNAVRADA